MATKKIINRKNQYVFPIGNAWAVKGEGSKKFTFITDNKREALTYAKDIAVNNSSDLIVYGKDGKIIERDSYSKKTGQLSKK